MKESRETSTNNTTQQTIRGDSEAYEAPSEMDKRRSTSVKHTEWIVALPKETQKNFSRPYSQSLMLQNINPRGAEHPRTSSDNEKSQTDDSFPKSKSFHDLRLNEIVEHPKGSDFLRDINFRDIHYLLDPNMTRKF